MGSLRSALMRSESQLTSRSTDSTPWRWSSPAYRSASFWVIDSSRWIRSSRSWSRIRRPSSTRSRISMSVEEKNANRMSKLSSSQAVGPTSDISRSNSRVPASVTW